MQRGRGCPGRTADAFTLVEVLLAMAIMAMMAALMLPGINSILRGASADTPAEIISAAITQARERALLGNRTVWLRLDKQESRLTWGDGSTAGLKRLPAGCRLQFLPPAQGGTILVGGRLLETTEMPGVRFYADGTCDAFRIQLEQGEAAPRILAIDRWTCAPILPGGEGSL